MRMVKFFREGEKLELINDTCVYDQGLHSAFTSLERWDDGLFLAFREAKSHGAEFDGKIRVLKKSEDTWILHHTFEIEGKDLRDPYLLVFDNKLFLYTSGCYSILTKDGWSDLEKIKYDTPHPLYLWKIRKYKKVLFGIGNAEGEWPVLLKSRDGINWESITTFKIGGNASEADITFIKDTIYICIRIDNPVGANSMWGSGKYPFTDIKWSMMPVSVASPELIYLSEQKLLLLSGREYYPNKYKGMDSIGVSVFLPTLDGEIDKRIIIPTRQYGDKGYPSFCYDKGLLYMSYYTGDGNHSSIRMSIFEVKQFSNE